ncbi:hypothetical protein PRIC1_011671 [Phytophthora ramorum]
MRVYITLLVAVAALFATSEAAVDTTTKLTNIATSASIADLQTQSNGQRYLRKRETDETDNEDRAFDVKKLGSTVKSFFTSKDKKLLKLLKSGMAKEDLLTKNVNPEALERAVQTFKTKLKPAEFEKFEAMATEYSHHWYRVANLDPMR